MVVVVVDCIDREFSHSVLLSVHNWTSVLFLACSAFRAFTIESCRLVGLQLILDFDTESSGKAEPLNLEASLV